MSPQQQPNIVVIMADQWRADALGCMGDDVVDTRNIDALAADGIAYTNAYCQAPLCMPSRASLLTERYVRDHGVADNSTEIPPAMPTFVSSLRDAGYRTAAIGKMHLWVHDEAGVHASSRLDRMQRFGFDDVVEAVGKMASTRILTAYTDHLRASGLEEAFLSFMTPRSTGGRAYQGAGEAKVPVPAWDTQPSPLPAADYLDSWIGRQAVTWLDDAPAQPFFLWIGFAGPHDPWDAPAEYVERYRSAAVGGTVGAFPVFKRRSALTELLLERQRKAGVPADGAEEAVAEVRRHYYANCSLIDEWVGRIIDSLRQQGCLDNTWIVFTSDHGEMLGDHGLFTKMVFFEGAVRVPLVVRPPGGRAPSQISDLVELIDVAATVRVIAGAGEVADSCAQPLPGLGLATSPRPVVCSQYGGFLMLRSDRWKLVVQEESRKAVQLFDLVADPSESENLCERADMRPLIEGLIAKEVDPFLARAAVRD